MQEVTFGRKKFQVINRESYGNVSVSGKRKKINADNTKSCKSILPNSAATHLPKTFVSAGGTAILKKSLELAQQEVDTVKLFGVKRGYRFATLHDVGKDVLMHRDKIMRVFREDDIIPDIVVQKTELGAATVTKHVENANPVPGTSRDTPLLF